MQPMRQGFFTDSNLIRHVRPRTREKPYQCSHCGKTFLENCIVIKHMRTLTGEKPYQCIHCGKTVLEKGITIKHMRSFEDIYWGETISK